MVSVTVRSPKTTSMVTTPGERSAKIRCGSNPLPGRGAAVEAAEAGKAAVRGAAARTTTVLVPWSSQPVSLPMPKAAPPPRAGAIRPRGKGPEASDDVHSSGRAGTSTGS